MNFWRNDDLTGDERRLVAETLEAHGRSAMRNNCSSAAVVNTFAGSRNYANAIAAALLTLGEVHGPITAACRLLSGKTQAAQILAAGDRVPGYGNAFVRGMPDPIWAGVDQLLKQNFSSIHATLWGVVDMLHKTGRVIYPNPAGFTGAVALAIRMPAELAPWLFVAGRLQAWSKRIADTL